MKSCCVLQDHYDDERDKIVFHNTQKTRKTKTKTTTCKTKTKTDFLVSDWSCPKTDGLRPHHWSILKERGESQSTRYLVSTSSQSCCLLCAFVYVVVRYTAFSSKSDNARNSLVRL